MLPESAAPLSVLELTLYQRVTAHWRATREPARTSVLAELAGTNESQLRGVLRRMEAKGIVRRRGQRGGWLPGERVEDGRMGQGKPRERKRARKDEALEFICRFAAENCGATPNSRIIAGALGLSQSRVQHLMLRLQLDGRIAYIDRYNYRVEQSVWEPPPYVQI